MTVAASRHDSPAFDVEVGLLANGVESPLLPGGLLCPCQAFDSNATLAYNWAALVPPVGVCAPG